MDFQIVITGTHEETDSWVVTGLVETFRDQLRTAGYRNVAVVDLDWRKEVPAEDEAEDEPEPEPAPFVRKVKTKRRPTRK